MLLQLCEFIRCQQLVSMQQLSREFHIDEEALAPMLAIWVRRGVIQIYEEMLGCKSSCFKCKINRPVLYQYVRNDKEKMS